MEGERKLDFAGWCAAIQSAAGSGGDTLSQQQLTDTDIPVIVHSCIGYITQCGEAFDSLHRLLIPRSLVMLQIAESDTKTVNPLYASRDVAFSFTLVSLLLKDEGLRV